MKSKAFAKREEEDVAEHNRELGYLHEMVGRMKGRFLTPESACLQLCSVRGVALCVGNHETTSSFNPHGLVTYGRDSQ